MSIIIQPVVICGGAGTRLWPDSREVMPKQFIVISGPRSTFQDTILRFVGPMYASPIVVTNNEYYSLVNEQLSEIGVIATIVAEPTRRESGPAVAVSALVAAECNPNVVVAVIAADLIVANQQEFQRICGDACVTAEMGFIVTLGIKPDGPVTFYSYICPGPGVGRAFFAERFIEKPLRDVAEKCVASGFLWNSGILFFRADVMIEELQAFEPEVLEAAKVAISKAKRDQKYFLLDAEAYRKSPKMTIDRAVLERTKRAAVIPADIGWVDVGNWDAVWQLTRRDKLGNSLHGDCVVIDSYNVHVRSLGTLTVVLGANNVVVATRQDAVLVMGHGHSDKVKQFVELMKSFGRREAREHKRAIHPWGYYQLIDSNARYQVTRIVVSRGQHFSAQRCYHRSKHWIVVGGTGVVTRGEETKIIHENESIFLPAGVKHGLFNPGKINLKLIEVETGSHLGGDDIAGTSEIYDHGAGK